MIQKPQQWPSGRWHAISYMIYMRFGPAIYDYPKKKKNHKLHDMHCLWSKTERVDFTIEILFLVFNNVQTVTSFKILNDLTFYTPLNL
jgi:hypothetical protein